MEFDRRSISDSIAYQGRRVVVSGCASGMGRATTQQLVGLGAEVHGLDYQDCDLELASFLQFDLRDETSIDAAVTKLVSRQGLVFDALFNCAGLPTTFPPIDIMKVNYIGTRRLTERLIPHMGCGGAICSISSAGGGIAWQRHLPILFELLAIEDFAEAVAWCEAHLEQVEGGYSLAKEAIVVWTMQTAANLVGKGIRINCTLPGATQTPMMVDHFEPQSPAAVQAFTIPIGRRSSPEEQARPLLFLNCGAASYINGVALPVDGGFLAGVSVGQIDLLKLLSTA